MEYILNNLDAGILKIELNHPEKRNALTLAMYTEFAELLNTAQTKPEIRVLLVSAAGDNYSREMIFRTFSTILPAEAIARKSS
jgi:enoyl-CoA hydratase/carnithine racemase